ncbi:MAG: hypothetical protein ACO1OB_01760 [Archangium sp.]
MPTSLIKAVMRAVREIVGVVLVARLPLGLAARCASFRASK